MYFKAYVKRFNKSRDGVYKKYINKKWFYNSFRIVLLVDYLTIYIKHLLPNYKTFSGWLTYHTSIILPSPFRLRYFVA